MAGRPSKLNDPEIAQQVAELAVRGVSRQEIADTFEVAKDTIRVWVKDPRVQAHARRLTSERVVRICRRIDGEIEARLEHIHGWDIDEILKVRKAYVDAPLQAGLEDGGDLGKVSNEISERMDNDPDFAEELLKLVEAEVKQKA